MGWTGALGTASGYVGMLAWLPQVRQTWATRQAADISWLGLWGIFLGIEYVLAYAWAIKSTPLLVSITPNAALVAAIIVGKDRADLDRPSWRLLLMFGASLAIVQASRWTLPAYLLGTAGGCVGVVSWIGQARRAWRRRSVADYSLACLVASWLATAGLVGYGFLIRSNPLITTQAAVNALVGALLAAKVAARLTRRREIRRRSPPRAVPLRPPRLYGGASRSSTDAENRAVDGLAVRAARSEASPCESVSGTTSDADVKREDGAGQGLV